MRRIDKKKNMVKANLLAEQRYLQSKGLISETILPLADGKFAFAEEAEENLPKYKHGEVISCTKSIVGETGTLEEGVKTFGIGAFLVCSMGMTSCEKANKDNMYKYVYDTEESLVHADKNQVPRRITCLLPSSVVLEDDVNERKRLMNDMRRERLSQGIEAFGDTIVRMDAPTPQSPYMSKDEYGRVIVKSPK